MIVRRFLLWARTASPGDRAEAVSSLARAYLYSDLSADDRWEAETAMTAMLDDPSPLVRRALAEAFANAPAAPRPIVIALAGDQPEVAALVLSRSPVLTDADLVDAVALGETPTQTAVAMRPSVSVGVSAALAEIASAEALLALLGNAGADIGDSSFRRMVERHGSNAELREALLRRPDVAADIRQSIAVALAVELSAFVQGCGWLSPDRSERAVREAREKTTIALSAEARHGEVERLVAHLRASGQLTPALILRALLSRALPLAEAALADLSGLPAARVAGLIRDRRGAGFAALYRRAGLPASLKPAFEAALSALREPPRADSPTDGIQLSRRMVERVLTACAELPPDEAPKLVALLRRFEVEAARQEAREIAGALADEAALSAVLAYMPQAIAEAVDLAELREAA